MTQSSTRQRRFQMMRTGVRRGGDSVPKPSAVKGEWSDGSVGRGRRSSEPMPATRFAFTLSMSMARSRPTSTGTQTHEILKASGSRTALYRCEKKCVKKECVRGCGAERSIGQDGCDMRCVRVGKAGGAAWRDAKCLLHSTARGACVLAEKILVDRSGCR